MPHSQKYTFLSLLKFSLPTMVMMLFMSMYTMMDGVFVSRLVGTKALAAGNVVFPLLNIVMALVLCWPPAAAPLWQKRWARESWRKRERILPGFTVTGAGLVVTAIGGVANIVLDYLFIAVFGWGIGGAAMATGVYCARHVAAAPVYRCRRHLAGGSLCRSVGVLVSLYCFCRLFRGSWRKIAGKNKV